MACTKMDNYFLLFSLLSGQRFQGEAFLKILYGKEQNILNPYSVIKMENMRFAQTLINNFILTICTRTILIKINKYNVICNNVSKF